MWGECEIILSWQHSLAEASVVNSSSLGPSLNPSREQLQRRKPQFINSGEPKLHSIHLHSINQCTYINIYIHTLEISLLYLKNTIYESIPCPIFMVRDRCIWIFPYKYIYTHMMVLSLCSNINLGHWLSQGKDHTNVGPTRKDEMTLSLMTYRQLFL